MKPPTREQHDEWVAQTGRPYTDRTMRHAKRPDEVDSDSGPSLVDRVLADVRHARLVTL